MDPKLSRGRVPVGKPDPYLIQRHLARLAEAYLRIKWYPDTSSRLDTIDMGRKVRAVARAEIPPYQVASSSMQPFGHDRHGPKSGELLCPLRGGGAGSPSNTMWPGSRLEAYTSMPSFIFGRPFVKRFALCYRTVVLSVCLSALSVTLVYCGQTVGRMKLETWHGGRPWPWPLCVRWGPSFPPQKGGTAVPPLFGPCLLSPNGRPS